MSPLSDVLLEAAEDGNPVGEEERNREEIFLTCFNLMIDVLNAQMELQGIEKHTGLTGTHVPDVIKLINKLLATPWLTDLSNGLEEAAYLNSINENFEQADEFNFIEELLTDFLQLIHGTLKKVIPLETFDDEENGDEANNTVNSGAGGGGGQGGGAASGGGMDSDTRQAILKKGTPGLGGFMAVLTTMQSTVEKPKQMEESSSESEDGNEDEFEVKLDNYGIPMQLVYHLLIR